MPLPPQVVMYRSNLEGITNDLNKSRAKFQRNALLSGPSGRPLEFDKSQDQRSRMMENTDKLRGGTDQLNDAHRTLEATSAVGEFGPPGGSRSEMEVGDSIREGPCVRWAAGWKTSPYLFHTRSHTRIHRHRRDGRIGPQP